MNVIDSAALCFSLLKDKTIREGREFEIAQKDARGSLHTVRLVAERQTEDELLLVDSFVGHHHRVFVWPIACTNRLNAIEDAEEERDKFYNNLVTESLSVRPC